MAAPQDDVLLSRPAGAGAELWRSLAQSYGEGGDAQCDLRLLCAGGGSLPCHRLVLAAVAENVRRAIRSLPPPEAMSDECLIIQLPDHPAEEVRSFLDALYTSLSPSEEGAWLDFGHCAPVLSTLGVKLSSSPFISEREREEAREAEVDKIAADPQDVVQWEAKDSSQLVVAKLEEEEEDDGGYVGHQEYDDDEEGLEEEEDEDEDDTDEEYLPTKEAARRASRKRKNNTSSSSNNRKRGRYNYKDEEGEDFLDDEDDDYEEEEKFGLDAEDFGDEMNGDDDFEEPSAAPKKKKKKKKKKYKYKKKDPKDKFPGMKRICTAVKELHDNVRDGSGEVYVRMRTSRFRYERDCGREARKRAQFMCLVGLRRKEGAQDEFSAVPLAWSAVDEEGELQEQKRDKMGKRVREFIATKEEEGGGGEGEEGEVGYVESQFSNFVSALRGAFGLSQLEAEFQLEAFERMEMGWYERKALKNRLALMLEHAEKSEAELRSLLEEERVAEASRIGSRKPFLLADDVRETFCAKFELCGHPAAAAALPLHGVALLTASAPEDGGAGAALMEAVCLDPGGANGDDREGEVRDVAKTLYDVWSLRRVDMNYIEPCLRIVRRYWDLEPRGDLWHACRQLLSAPSGGELRRELASDSVRCVDCQEEIPSATVDDLLRLDAHKRSHRLAERYECGCTPADDPSLDRSSPRSVRLHAERVHLGEGAGMGRCQYCEFFAAPEAMERHAAREHRPTNCEVCGSSEMGLEGVRLHRALLHPGRPRSHRTPGSTSKRGKWKAAADAGEEGDPGGGGGGSKDGGTTVETCHVCGKEFRSHAYFQVHMRIHNTYTCDICGKVILGYNIMRSHKRKEHPDPNKIKGYPCEVCGKMMSSKMRMKEHILRIHAPDHERPHLCPDCGRGFARRGELEAHRNVVHIKNRPYACRFGCGEAFNHYATRGDHEKSKHGMRFPKSKAQDQMEKIFRPRPT